MRLSGLYQGTKQNVGGKSGKEVDQDPQWTMVSRTHNKLYGWADLKDSIQKSRGLKENNEASAILSHNAKDHGEGLHVERDNSQQR